ncbi:MAG: beta-N-acetylhexosaminidase [Burkholderiales bacterium]|nr:beta-N-acetylhexosaminidase [Burkholderiales bacterium]
MVRAPGSRRPCQRQRRNRLRDLGRRRRNPGPRVLNPHPIRTSPVVIDIPGTALTAADRRRIRHPLTGGLILFARNFEDRRQLTELAAAVKKLRPDLLICVDHEGGRVQRFRSDGFTALPAMRTLGEQWQREPLAATDAATALGLVLAAELRACGVDLSFAPVLDLDHGASSVIGDRAFHRDPRVVALLAKSVIHGMLRAGMACCGKHFPGHGHVAADSHHEVPIDRRGLKAILDDDARPYDWLSTALAAVMPAHVVYPRVDRRPAGFSARWLQEILRGRFGFCGAIFSDDLGMEGARHLEGSLLAPVEAATLALEAGCDMVLLCNPADGSVVDELLAGLERAAAEDRWHPDPESEVRRLALLPQTAPLAWDELMHDPAYQHALERLP